MCGCFRRALTLLLTRNMYLNDRLRRLCRPVLWTSQWDSLLVHRYLAVQALVLRQILLQELYQQILASRTLPQPWRSLLRQWHPRVCPRRPRRTVLSLQQRHLPQNQPPCSLLRKSCLSLSYRRSLKKVTQSWCYRAARSSRSRNDCWATMLLALPRTLSRSWW